MLQSRIEIMCLFDTVEIIYGFLFMSSIEVDANLFTMSLLTHQLELFLLCCAHPLLSYISTVPNTINSIPFGADTMICQHTNTLILDSWLNKPPIQILLSSFQLPFSTTETHSGGNCSLNSNTIYQSPSDYVRHWNCPLTRCRSIPTSSNLFPSTSTKYFQGRVFTDVACGWW